MSILDTQNNTFLPLLTENTENVSFLMKTIINMETTDVEAYGLDLIYGNHASVVVCVHSWMVNGPNSYLAGFHTRFLPWGGGGEIYWVHQRSAEI